jgi:hypothetical protein
LFANVGQCWVFANIANIKILPILADVIFKLDCQYWQNFNIGNIGKKAPVFNQLTAHVIVFFLLTKSQRNPKFA